MYPMTFTVPELETERTVMRGFVPDDLAAVAAWSGDPEVMRFLGGAADADQAWRTMALYVGHWHLRGYGLWAVERKSDGQLIGRVGLWNPAGWPGIEIGWAFSRLAWGGGYATECGAATVAWTWANLPELEQILAIIVPENLASRRVAERLGMTVLGPYTLMGEIDTLLYGLDRPTA